ncbi:uncharacterized protein VTP21DRAFT_7348 [Calcarisporiella thermophila]|uniref:uncharacterized protein n=1 Tax=Calcarisporiella thermophila TaxID=911321 RepID=UPI003742063A
MSNYLNDKREDPPPGWPQGVVYTSRLVWSKAVPKSLQDLYTLPMKSPLDRNDFFARNVNIRSSEVAGCIDTKQTRKRVRIRQITDPQHPCQGAYGLFATTVLPPKSFVLDYIGVVEHEDSYSKTSDYVLRFGPNLSIDAEKIGNEGRFVNDYRGCGPKPNVQFLNYLDERTGHVRIGVFVLGEKIKKGEELLVTYGKSFWKSRGLIS